MAKFISFGNSKKQHKENNPEPINFDELKEIAISISLDASKLLDSILKKDISISSVIIEKLRKNLDLIPEPTLEKSTLSVSETTNYIAFTGTTVSNSSVNTINYPNHVKEAIEKNLKDIESDLLKKFRETFIIKNEDRILDNGGMAPPKDCKSIANINLKSSEKFNFIEEMRKLRDKGITITKSNLHHNSPVSIEEFTEPFKYIENLNDYNGSFLVTLIKTEIDISNAESNIQIVLTKEKEACLNGECLILSILDINSSFSSGEHKRFLIILDFDKLNGTLRFSKALFLSNKDSVLSCRQNDELIKFCRIKKINL